MRNVVATVVQTAALGCITAGLFLVNAFLAVGLVLAVAGFLLAPERKK